jgi:hypothetical protein
MLLTLKLVVWNRLYSAQLCKQRVATAVALSEEAIGEIENRARECRVSSCVLLNVFVLTPYGPTGWHGESGKVSWGSRNLTIHLLKADGSHVTTQLVERETIH